VWCPKYRRSVRVDGADEALKRIVERTCLARQADLIDLEVMPDHVHLVVDVDPQYGIHRLVKELKGTSSRQLGAKFAFLKRRLPTLWTNSDFVSSIGGAPLAVVEQYIENRQARLSPGAPWHTHLHRRAGAGRLGARRARAARSPGPGASAVQCVPG